MTSTMRRALIAGTAVAVLAGGGAAMAGAASGDDDGPGDRPDTTITDRAVIDRATEVALGETGGGTVTEIEAADDGMTGYEVEVDRPDGGAVEVNLDRDFGVVSVENDD